MSKFQRCCNYLAVVVTVGGQFLVAEAVSAQQPARRDASSSDRASVLVGRDQFQPGAIAPFVSTLSDWLVQASEPIEIADIQINATETGIEIILVTASGTLPLPAVETVGNALIAEIPNAVLLLPDADDFFSFDPVDGIALVQAINTDEQTVQLSITGSDAPPTADIRTQETGLRFAVARGIPSDAADDDAIQILAEDPGSRYVEPRATTGTRTDTPWLDIPQSIQIIPQAVLEDQQVLRLNDALRNVSGVVAGSNDPRGQRFSIRGFASSSVLRDGFRLTAGASGNSGFPELANIEQLEVLKGPAAILFGSLEPGGVVNLVSEQPLSEPFYELNARAGSRGLLESGIDLSGPLSEDGDLSYRLNALYRTEDSFRNFTTPIERFFVAPTVKIEIGDSTDLILDFEYRYDERPADFGLVAFEDRVLDVPRDRNLGEPDDNFQGTFLRTGYRFEHRFTDNWQVRNNFYYTRYAPQLTGALFLRSPLAFDESTGTLIRNFAFFDQPSDSFEIQTNVVGEFTTGPVEHTLLAGVDFYRRQASSLALLDILKPLPLNVFDPVYDATRPDFSEVPVAADSSSNIDSLGIYVQDQIDLFDNLKLLAGIRYETITTETIIRPSFIIDGSETTQTENAFSPRVGIVYQPIEAVSLFASYSRSFVPNTAITVEGETIEPELGEQFEVGVKAELLGGGFSASLAYFNLTKENVATTDPNFSLFFVATGQQQSQGIEIDLTGEILPGWNAILNYAYIDATITEDNNTELIGNRLSSVPENNLNLWTTYEIQAGSLEGLGFGVGFNYVGQRFGDNANSFELDDYFLTNAALFYRRDNWRAGLNIRNLFDVDYIESSENTRLSEINPGAGLTIVGSFAIEF